MTSHALVPFIGSSQSDQSSQPGLFLTEFGMFLLALKNNQQKEHRLSGESLVWCDEPLEEIVLSGVWVIMQKIGDLIGETLHTRAQTQLVAGRVDRLINGGILLEYDTPEAAAQAFIQKVILLVRRAVSLGYVPGMSVSVLGWKALLRGEESLFKTFLPKSHDHSKTGSILTHWQAPSALFFSELIKTARNYRRQLSAELEVFTNLNKITQSDRLNLAYIDAQDVEGLADRVVYSLSEEQSVSIPLPKDTRDVGQMLHKAITRCNLFRCFRVDWSDWRSDFLLPIVLESGWLNTQILLAQTQAPSQQEFLEGAREYAVAVSALKEFGNFEMVDRVCARLTARLRTPLDDSQWTILREKIERQIEVFRTWDPGFINENAMNSLLIRINEKDALLLDPSIALAIASGKDILLFEQMCKSDVDLQSVLVSIALSLVWETLDVEDLIAIVRAHILPLEIFLDGLRQCSPKYQQEVVLTILLDSELHEASLQLLIDSDLVEIDFSFIRNHIERLPPLFLGDRLLVLLQNAATTFDAPDVAIFWRALGRAPRELAQRFVNDERSRRELCQVVSEVIVSMNEGVNWKSFDDVHLNLGETCYHELLLGTMAYMREEMRQEDGLVRLDSWHRIFIVGSPIFVKSRALGTDVSEAKIRKLLKMIPEERARTWAKLQ